MEETTVMQSAIRDSSSTGSPAKANVKPRGWWSRNWKRLFLSLIGLAVVGAGIGYCYKFGRTLISEPYHQAIAELQQSAEVKQLLGEPIQDNWFPVGSVSVDQGEARFILKVHGPKTADGREPKADVSVQARLVSGKWGFTQFDVTPEEGQRLNLMDEYMARVGSDVEQFNPNAIQQPQPKTPAAPPPDINITLPPDMPSGAGSK
jgi:hypothetical protein